MKTIADLRKSYELGELNEDKAPADPMALFSAWLEEALARKVPEPSAMTVATVDGDGRPSTRIVLLKGYDSRGLVWFTNYLSRKGRQLATNPAAALQFHWVELERVARIEGIVQKVADAESDAYFQSRPLASRIGAWASEQSSVIDGRGVLIARAAEYGVKFGLNPPRPPHWGGYRLLPQRWEFWQGRPSRLHDRLAYRRESGADSGTGLGTDVAWIRERLAP
jgi:pyridoxamine 5'-phosphate oxidase